MKASYRLDQLAFSADLQFRQVNYSFLGIDDVSGQLQDLKQNVQFNFFNPKVGVNYSINSRQFISATFGIANREPVRKDFRES